MFRPEDSGSDGVRQVNEAELVWRLKFQLGRISASLRNDLASRTHDVRKRAEQLLAERLVADALGRYEVLSSAPLPPGTDLFSRAAYGGANGSAPTIEDQGEP